MGLIQRIFGGQPEARAPVEDPNVPLSANNIIEALGWDFGTAATGVQVTTDSALGVPAIWAAINFISGTIAGLPLHVYQRTDDGRDRVEGSMARLLHDAVNDETTSFEWRQTMFSDVFTGGRSYTFIERNGSGEPINLWPLEANKVTPERKGGKRKYKYREGRGTKTYDARDVIDIWFKLRSDRISHYSPIHTNRDAIGLAIAATRYGSKFFQNGGVPPFAIEGPFTSPGAIQRASDDLTQAVRAAAKENRLALSIPAGHTIKSLGFDPEKMQLVELQRFCVEQSARIYSLPPTFLQDLTHGTFSNTEQQDLHVAKHTLKRWIEQFEAELNLKLFGRDDNSRYVELNVDGLLRGDFKTRMDGLAIAVQNGLMTPNEGRETSNRPAMEGGNQLMIQGATVPIVSQTAANANTETNDNGI